MENDIIDVWAYAGWCKPYMSESEFQTGGVAIKADPSARSGRIFFMEVIDRGLWYWKWSALLIKGRHFTVRLSLTMRGLIEDLRAAEKAVEDFSAPYGGEAEVRYDAPMEAREVLAKRLNPLVKARKLAQTKANERLAYEMREETSLIRNALKSIGPGALGPWA